MNLTRIESGKEVLGGLSPNSLNNISKSRKKEITERIGSKIGLLHAELVTYRYKLENELESFYDLGGKIENYENEVHYVLDGSYLIKSFDENGVKYDLKGAPDRKNALHTAALADNEIQSFSYFCNELMRILSELYSYDSLHDVRREL